MIMIANVITVARVFLAVACLALLFMPCQDMTLWALIALTWFIMYLDALDGYLARKLKQATKFGGVLDIACDRAVEMLYPIVFASIGWMPVWVPILFLLRGMLVDAVRARYAEEGYTAFGEKTMMQSRLGRLLVSSHLSRGTYNASKGLAYSFVIASHTQLGIAANLSGTAMALVYFMSFFCLLRGLPVILEGTSIFYEEKQSKSGNVALN